MSNFYCGLYIVAALWVWLRVDCRARGYTVCTDVCSVI